MSDYYTNLKYRTKEAIDAINDDEYKFTSTAAQNICNFYLNALKTTSRNSYIIF